MSRKQEAIFMGIGVLAGLVLSGAAAHAATTITATLSDQPIYVDGQQVAMTAYHIGGNNYVRLRDIGRAVDFGVTYDAVTNTVHINSTKPYQEETSPATPGGVTEENVQAVLADLRTLYPSGTEFPTPYRSTSNGPYSRGIHCSGWATLYSDAVFGNLPWRQIDRPNWEQIRPGDVVVYRNDESHHAIVVVSRMDDYIKVTESGMNNRVRWGGQYFRWWLEEQVQCFIYTWYPQ